MPPPPVTKNAWACSRLPRAPKASAHRAREPPGWIAGPRWRLAHGDTCRAVTLAYATQQQPAADGDQLLGARTCGAQLPIQG